MRFVWGFGESWDFFHDLLGILGIWDLLVLFGDLGGFGDLFFIFAICLGICFFFMSCSVTWGFFRDLFGDLGFLCFSQLVWGIWDLGICFLRFVLGVGDLGDFFLRDLFGDLWVWSFFRDLFGDLGIWGFVFFFAICLGICLGFGFFFVAIVWGFGDLFFS